MRSIKKIIIILFLIFILFQGYWRISYGSTILYFQNDNPKEQNTKIELYVNNNLLQEIYVDLVSKEIKLKEKLGYNSKIKIVNEYGIVSQFEVNNLVVNWVVVSVYKNEITLSKSIIPPFLQ